MNQRFFVTTFLFSTITICLLALPNLDHASLHASSAKLIPPAATLNPATTATAAQPNININGVYATDKVQRGRTTQAAVVMDIPNDLHVTSNKLLGKFGVPTVLRIEAPNGVQVSPVSYPRAAVRRFGFSKDQLAVYEGRTVMRFNVTVPAGYQGDSTELRARLKFQSCTNDTCYPPTTREITMPIQVVNAADSVQRANTQIFPARGRRN